MNDLCSIELLQNAVARGLSAEEEAAPHAHLEHCESCCAQMEQLAGGEAWQQEAAELLSADELDAAVPESANWSEVDFSVEHLDPSDDANVLGQLGGYDVLAVVGRGGMGVVLKAFDRELKRLVAIKALAPHLAHSSVARKRFAREAQAAAAVVNPHVIAIHHVQPTGRLPFLIMPLLTGESLAQRLKARGPLELTEVLRIGMQAATGLAAAHDQGLVHRDVKPANIFLEKGVERVVITDFGLARAADDVSMTRMGVVAGTPEYMSPEQARGEALDGRSDLFSLGCVLYEMATGVSPFRTDSTMATLRRIVDEQPAAMASLVPELPPWFSHIVERLLSKAPAQRFASASEVSQLLEQCLSHLQQPTSVPLPASLVPHAAGRRSIFNVTRKGVIAMLGTIGMTLLGMVLWQATDAPNISGQWTSDEWGTVVLEAKGSREYEGTFTGTGKVKPAASNVPLVGDPGADTSRTYPMLGPGWIQAKDESGNIFLRQGLAKDDFDKAKSGAVRLKWSRLERRFNGTWGKGAGRSGTMSLRLVDKEIRGGFTTDEEVQLETGTPLVGDLLWKRSAVTVPDGGNVLLGGMKTTDEAANTPRKLSPGEILVEVYGGRGIWKSREKQNEVGKLLLSLKAVKGVTVDIREDGEGDAVTKAVVHMPAHAGEKNAESTKQEALIRTIKDAIDEALRTHRVPDVRWLDGIGKQQYFPADKMPAQPTNSAIPARVKYFTAGDGKKIACSPDGKLIAVASSGKAFPSAEGWKRTVEILDAETGKAAVSISLTTQEEDALLATTEGPRDFEVGALAFSPDGRLLAVGTGLGQVKLFESRTGKLVLSLDDEAARLADQKTPKKPKSLKRAMGSVRSLAFSADGTLLATSGLSFEDAAPNWGGVHELGELATGPGRLKVWAVQSGTLRNDLVGHSHANAVAFSPNGAYLASVGSWQGGVGSDHDGSGVILWAPNTGIKLRTCPINTNGSTWSVAFSPNGKLMAISSRTFDKDNDTSTSSISLLRTATGILEWKQTVSGWGHPVAFSPDGKSVGVLCGGEAIRFFDTETGTLKHHLGLADHSQGARWNDFALLPQGKLAIAGVDNARQGKVEIWDFTGPNIKASAIEKPLDRQNARAVVEAFVAAALARDVAKAAALAKSAPPVSKRLAEFPKLLNVERLAISKVYVNDPANPTEALATSEGVKLENEHKQPNGERDCFLVFTVSMGEEGWIVTDIIDFESEESADRELKKFLEANPKAISVPPQREAQAREARANPVVGHWKVVKLADMPVDQLAGATVVIDEHRVKMHVPSQKGLYADWRYSLGANDDLDLFDADDAKGESTSRAKYSLNGKALCLALNAKKGDLPRPVSATGEVPQEGVLYIVLESDEEAQSSEAAKAPDAGRGTREGHSQAPEQPALSKTLKQLQGEWRVTRQIHANGEEEGRSGNSILEFNGNRIVKHGGEPGDAMLIQADESHSPVRVEIALGSTQDSVLGLLSVEGDMLILCYGKHQKTPAPESRPEKLQWVSGVWYMELQRVKPGETIVPLKPNSRSQPQQAPSISEPPQAASETAQSATGSADAPPNTKMSMPTRVKLFTTGDGKKVACSPDGKLIAVASGGKALPAAEGWKRTVEILDAETGRTAVSISLTTQDEDALLAATEGPRDFEVGALAFSPDGTLLAVGTGLGQVKLFDSRTGTLILSLDDEPAKLAEQITPEKLKSLKRAMGSVGSLAFSPDGTRLATSGRSFDDAAPNWRGRMGETPTTGPGRLKVWDVKTGALIHDLVGHSYANAVSFSADGNLLASAGHWSGEIGTGVIIWNARTGGQLRAITNEAKGSTYSVVFSPHGNLVAIGSRRWDIDNNEGTTTVSLISALSGITEWQQLVPGLARSAFLPDSKSLLVLCGGESIRFFDTDTGALKHHLGLADPWKDARWNDFALLPQGRLAIAGVDNARQGKVEIWDFTGPNPISISVPPQPFTAWGKEVGGLQAGLGFEYGNRRTYGHGQGITLVVRLRNVGKEAVKFEYLRQFLDENPPTVTNADDKTIPQSKTEVMGQHVPVIVTLEAGKEMVLETRLHGSNGVPYVLIPPNSKEKRDDKVTPLVVATGKCQLQIEKVFGNSSSGFLKVDPALEKLSTGKLELEVIR